MIPIDIFYQQDDKLVTKFFFSRYERILKKKISTFYTTLSVNKTISNFNGQSTNKILEIPSQSVDVTEFSLKKNKNIQVDVFTLDDTSPFGTSVVIFAGKDRCDGICHAETQIYTPTEKHEKCS